MDKIKKPDYIVAEKVVNQLITKNLLFETEKEKWMKKLSKEGVSSEDWNLLADFYTEKHGKNR